jgi:hypothetical protein
MLMTTTVAVLTRETALPLFTSPTGRSFKIQPWLTNPGLYEIAYSDKKPGEMPRELVGKLYTSRKRAEEALTKYLTEFWDLSDSNKKK